jgi:hypothetical protein
MEVDSDRGRIVVGWCWFGHKTTPILQHRFQAGQQPKSPADQGKTMLSNRLTPFMLFLIYRISRMVDKAVVIASKSLSERDSTLDWSRCLAAART